MIQPADIRTGGVVFPPVSAIVVGKLLDLTERRVHQLVKQGVLSKSDRGKYDLLTSVKEYVVWLHRNKKPEVTDDPEKMQPKERLDWYKGSRERDHHAKEQDILIPFDLEEQIIGAAFAAVRASLMSQHNSIAAQYPEIPADAIRWIHAANRELLARLSETRIPESIAGALDALTVESGAAAGSDGKPMG